MEPLSIGDLRHSLIFEQLSTRSPDAEGFSNDSYTTIDTVQGSINPLSERELNLGRTVGSTTTHKVTIRYFAALATSPRGTIRIRYGSRIFTINQIINVEERNYRHDLSVTEAHRT